MYNNGDQMVSVLKFLFAKCCQYVYTGGVLYGKISDVLNEIPTLVVDSLLWRKASGKLAAELVRAWLVYRFARN